MKRFCAACCRKPCECGSYNGPRQPYGAECEHEYEADEDHDARELICPNCGHREPMPIDWPA
jgi:hypothetical protein